ncbi:MAG: outer membrane beta-barrel protein [Bacteroidales bacterium]
MKTRLFIIVLIAILSYSFAIAQDAKRISFAVLGGVNFQNLNGKDFNGDKLENDMIIGYHAGINLQMPVAPEFYFQPGLLFTTKGAKSTNGSAGSTTKLSYIELPLNFVYKGLLGNGYILVGFGPYIGYGIMGKVISENDTETDIEFISVVENGNILTPYYRAFDAGGNIFAGYEMASGIFFQLNTQLGMLKINPEYKIFPDDKSLVKNTGFGVSLGYRF